MLQLQTDINFGYVPDGVMSADGAVGVAYLSRPWRPLCDAKLFAFYTQSCSSFARKAVCVPRAKLFVFYMQRCSPFTCKDVRFLHPKMFAFYRKSCRVPRAKLFAFYTQSCSRSTGKAVRLLHAKLFAFYMQGSLIYLTFAVLIYKCLTLSILREEKHFNLTLLVGLLCKTRSCLSYVPWGVVTDVVIGVGSILRCYIAPGDSASNPGGLVKDLLSK